MGEFFRGWRRKVGVMTLMLALVLMGGWVRSQRVSDLFIWRHDEITVFRLVSKSECLSFERRSELKNTHLAIKKSYWSGDANSFDDYVDHYNGNPYREKWSIEFAGFRFREGFKKFNVSGALDWMVPYWAIVIPLTLIAVWLLHSKPPKSNQ